MKRTATLHDVRYRAAMVRLPKQVFPPRFNVVTPA